MRDSTRKFLVEIDVPKNFGGFELLGEALDMMVELMNRGRRIYLGDICEQLGKEHGMTARAADRAMRRCIDGVVRQSYKSSRTRCWMKLWAARIGGCARCGLFCSAVRRGF